MSTDSTIDRNLGIVESKHDEMRSRKFRPQTLRVPLNLSVPEVIDKTSSIDPFDTV